jgi:hypothetical protein
MSARFQRDIKRRTFGPLARALQRDSLGMGPSARRRLAAAENIALGTHDYGAHGWIGPSLPETAPRQHQRLCQMMKIGRAHGCVRERGSILNGRLGVLGRIAACELAEQSLEILGLAEVLINRRKTDIGHIVERFQGLHD